MEVFPSAAAYSANIRHILCPIHFIGIVILDVSRLSFSDAHSLLLRTMTIFLLYDDLFLTRVDILIIGASQHRLLLVALNNIGGRLALVMLQVIQLDLPNVGTGDIRASAGMPFKLVLDYLGLLKAILLTRIRHQILYLQDLSVLSTRAQVGLQTLLLRRISGRLRRHRIIRLVLFRLELLSVSGSTRRILGVRDVAD